MVIGNQENNLDSFLKTFYVNFLLLLLCLVLKMHSFTKPLGSWTKQMYNPLKWDRTQVKILLAEHSRTKWRKDSPFSSTWSCQVKPSKYSRERRWLILLAFESCSKKIFFFQMIKGKTKEIVKVKELILCGRKLQLWTLWAVTI